MKNELNKFSTGIGSTHPGFKLESLQEKMTPENKFYAASVVALSNVKEQLLTKYPKVKSYKYNDRMFELELHNGTLSFSLDFHYDGDHSFYIVKPNGGHIDGKVLDINHQSINC